MKKEISTAEVLYASGKFSECLYRFVGFFIIIMNVKILSSHNS